MGLDDFVENVAALIDGVHRWCLRTGIEIAISCGRPDHTTTAERTVHQPSYVDLDAPAHQSCYRWIDGPKSADAFPSLAQGVVVSITNRNYPTSEVSQPQSLGEEDVDRRMITLRNIRELNISQAASPNRPLHISAASGLVRLATMMYVVADDEVHLGAFSATGSEAGHLVRLFDGALPESKDARKRQKPDLEALTLLPASRKFPNGALLAIGSGSRENRRRGVLLALDAVGGVAGPPRTIDLSPFLGQLDEVFSEVNIEGAIIVGNEFRLFQRGSKGQPGNAIIRFPLSPVLEVLAGYTDTIEPSSIDSVELGSIKGVPFCFTDAAALPGGAVVFSAVAEDTEDAFRDGPCVGAAIGVIDDQGHLCACDELDLPYKVEGIHARLVGKHVELLLVTDPDNSDVAATLFSATMVLN